MNDHVFEELGAYVLGGLEPADRRAVERHLETCGSCRDELARLSVLPPLLDRLTPEEATADLGDWHLDVAALGGRVADLEGRRLRRRLAAWRAATAVAAAAAMLLALWTWEPWDEPPDRLVADLVAVTDDAAATEGTVAAYAWEWGTTVEVRVADLPDRSSYVLWAVRRDGHRERAGTWGPTRDGGAMVRGASAIARADLSHVQVTDDQGVPLLDATFTGVALPPS